MTQYWQMLLKMILMQSEFASFSTNIRLWGIPMPGTFFVQDAESLDGIPKKLLIHHRTGGIVVDMLTIFDVM